MVTRALGALAVCASVGMAAAALALGALPAAGETEPPSSAGAAACPTPNPPDELALIAGTPQTATLGSVFATNLQVALTNGNGCPVTTAVAGTPVTFSAPALGASGTFSASAANTVTVGSDASGMVAAPLLTADDAAGSYAVTARSAYGSISFALTNAEGGDVSRCGDAASVTPPLPDESPAGLADRPTRLTVGIGATQSTPAGMRFPIRLAVTVTNAESDPLPGALVTFTAPTRGPSGYFTVPLTGASIPTAQTLPSGASRSSAHRWRTTRHRRVQVRTDACGIALAPAFTANHRQGGYVMVASAERVKAAFALVNEGR